ncbi:MAG: carbon-nitrogen hydrolase family protein, partial [Pseudomonadota bacterium]
MKRLTLSLLICTPVFWGCNEAFVASDSAPNLSDAGTDLTLLDTVKSDAKTSDAQKMDARKLDILLSDVLPPDAKKPDVLPPDTYLPPDTTVDSFPYSSFKVAAVQYSSGDHAYISNCANDLCGLAYFIQEAATKSAVLVVTPEYAVEQTTAELAPDIGDWPAKDARWGSGSIMKTFTKLADSLNITLIFNLITQEGYGSSAKLYNTSVAVNGSGKVLARHYKFQLYGNESNLLTPGSSVQTSFFDTPAGKIGMLICADVHCMVTNMTTSSGLCSKQSINLLQSFMAKN